jgi:hypothetical protein
MRRPFPSRREPPVKGARAADRLYKNVSFCTVRFGGGERTFARASCNNQVAPIPELASRPELHRLACYIATKGIPKGGRRMRRQDLLTASIGAAAALRAAHRRSEGGPRRWSWRRPRISLCSTPSCQASLPFPTLADPIRLTGSGKKSGCHLSSPRLELQNARAQARSARARSRANLRSRSRSAVGGYAVSVKAGPIEEHK